MDRIDDVLKLLNNLILYIVDEMVKINKTSLSDIKICLQNAHENIEFLQLETKLQHEELQQRSHHSEPVSVQKIETNSHKQQDNNVIVHSDKEAVIHADAETQSALPKPIIKPWEQLFHNKHRTGLGYDKDLSFHIPDYAKPIQFQSARILHDSSPPAVLDSAPLPKQQQQQQIVKCQHYD